MATMGQRLDVTGHRDEIHVDTEQLGDDVMQMLGMVTVQITVPRTGVGESQGRLIAVDPENLRVLVEHDAHVAAVLGSEHLDDAWPGVAQHGDVHPVGPLGGGASGWHGRTSGCRRINRPSPRRGSLGRLLVGRSSAHGRF